MQNNDDYYKYSVYGLNIKSPIPLHGLTKTNAKADVNIRFDKITDEFLKDNLPVYQQFDKPKSFVKVAPQAMFYDWQEIGKTFIRNGNEVIIESKENTRKEDISPFLTGLILGVLLHQRDNFVLHSSAVNINGKSFAFLGNKGYGKSTLAAHLQVKGHQLISDDLVPIKFKLNDALTIPGFPRIKLYEDSIKSVGSNPINFPLINRLWHKRAFQFVENLSVKPIKIDCLCVLGKSEKIELSSLSFADSFIALTLNTYLHPYLRALNYEQKHFNDCSKIIKAIPMVKLTRPASFEKMGHVINLLENFASTLNENVEKQHFETQYV